MLGHTSSVSLSPCSEHPSPGSTSGYSTNLLLQLQEQRPEITVVLFSLPSRRSRSRFASLCLAVELGVWEGGGETSSLGTVLAQPHLSHSLTCSGLSFPCVVLAATS